MAEINIFPVLNDGDSHTELLDDFIKRLILMRGQIPKDNRIKAFVCFSCTGDYATTYADITY